MMDYLPRPAHSPHPPPEVPFVANFQYNEEDIANFWLPAIFDVDEHCYAHRLIPLDAASLQSWLFFGVISAFTGRVLRIEDFRRRSALDDARDRVCTEPLIALLKDPLWYGSWKLRLKECTRGPADLLEKVWLWMKSLEVEPLCLESPIPLIIASIKVLITSLHWFWIRAIGIKREDPRAKSGWTAVSLPPPGVPPCPSARILLQWLREAGMCPSMSRERCTHHDWATVYYISRIHREPPSRHSGCSDTACVAYNTTEQTYVTRHVKDGCTCSLVEIPVEKMRGIITKGRIPLAKIENRPHGRVELEVEEATVNSEYVAFSHVWKHGLGNPRANSLPQCQLVKLQALLDGLPEPTGFRALVDQCLCQLPSSISRKRQPRQFWFDTLCIPVGSEHRALRIKAIDAMDGIYACAAQVLVLDADLENYRIGVSIPAENLGHVLCSPWMSRCWTLQEGAIGLGNCRIVFADGVLDPDRTPLALWQLRRTFPFYSLMGFRSLFDLLMKGRVVAILKDFLNVDDKEPRERDFQMLLLHQIHNNLQTGCSRQLLAHRQRSILYSHSFRLRGPPSILNGDGSPTEDFCSLWNALGVRSTTKPEDLLMILANLLNFRASQVMSLPSTGERMHAMLLSLKHVPLDLLCNTGPRLDANKLHKNRWLPTEASNYQLTSKLGMSVNSGYLTVEIDPSYSWASFAVDSSFVNKTAETVFVTINGQKWILTLHRSLDDELDISLHQKSLLLIDQTPNPGSSTLRGALLHVVQARLTGSGTAHEQGSMQAPDQTETYTIYDCPLQLEWYARSGKRDNKHDSLSQQPDMATSSAGQRSFLNKVEPTTPLLGIQEASHRIHIVTEVPPIAEPFPRRDYKFLAHATVLKDYAEKLAELSYCLALGFMIAIFVKTPYAKLNPSAQRSGIAFFICWLFREYEWHLIPSIIFLAVRQGAEQRLLGFEVAFGITALLPSCCVSTLLPLINHIWIKPYSYEVWLRGFGAELEPSRTHRFFEWLLSDWWPRLGRSGEPEYEL